LERLSIFMQYLSKRGRSSFEQLPTLAEIGDKLGISVASLREQLEVARSLGLVEVKPRVGIRILPYSFRKTLEQSLAYSLAVEPGNFQYYSDLRNHIESCFWEQATRKLLPEDFWYLRDLIRSAEIKLHGHPIQIPQSEHREFHLTIFKRLENPFVTGLLEAYWDIYEVEGLNLFNDYDYLERVWQYHLQMLLAIQEGNLVEGNRLLVEHMNLLSHRPTNSGTQKFNGFE
jgi:DNA-binding FadR family transcriptional regulator